MWHHGVTVKIVYKKKHASSVGKKVVTLLALVDTMSPFISVDGRRLTSVCHSVVLICCA